MIEITAVYKSEDKKLSAEFFIEGIFENEVDAANALVVFTISRMILNGSIEELIMSTPETEEIFKKYADKSRKEITEHVLKHGVLIPENNGRVL